MTRKEFPVVLCFWIALKRALMGNFLFSFLFVALKPSCFNATTDVKLSV